MSQTKANTSGEQRAEQVNGIDINGQIHESEHLDGPVVRARFRWDEPEGQDSFVVRCPCCNGEKHYHRVHRHPRTTLGGLSPAMCRDSRERYYLILAENGKGPTCEIIHAARREVTNLPGDKLHHPLIPEGIDPRVIADLLGDWD